MKLVPEKDPLTPARIADSYKALVTAAKTLNTTSDELGTEISTAEELIQQLNLGIEAWVEFAGWDDPHTLDYEKKLIGYTKLGYRWGLAIRVAKGNENRPDEEFSDTNRFNESPRALRVPAIEKLPELLDRLAKKAESTSKKIQAATTQARDVNAILKQTAKELAKPAK